MNSISLADSLSKTIGQFPICRQIKDSAKHEMDCADRTSICPLIPTQTAFAIFSRPVSFNSAQTGPDNFYGASLLI
jgi:hypothetical protein